MFCMTRQCRMLPRGAIGVVIGSNMTGYGTKGAIWTSVVIIEGKVLSMNNLTHTSDDVKSLVET